MEDNIVSNKSLSWDVVLKINGNHLKIDEKARHKDYGDFLIEIVQDLRTGNKGWLFKEKDYYFYASWGNNLEPESFYSVNSKLLQDFIIQNWFDILPKLELSVKGWGVTLFAKLDWQDLIYTKIAKKLL